LLNETGSTVEYFGSRYCCMSREGMIPGSTAVAMVVAPPACAQLPACAVQRPPSQPPPPPPPARLICEPVSSSDHPLAA
jgi:hypothetical protein